jgi:CBS domain-containing protein
MKTKLASLISSKHAVPSITSDSLVSTAIWSFHETRSSSLLVKTLGGELCGLISEHDVVDAIAKNGQAALSRPITDFMTVDLIVCTPEQSVYDALKIMSKKRIRHMPVVTKDGHLMGFLSILELLTSIDLEDGS